MRWAPTTPSPRGRCSGQAEAGRQLRSPSTPHLHLERQRHVQVDGAHERRGAQRLLEPLPLPVHQERHRPAVQPRLLRAPMPVREFVMSEVFYDILSISAIRRKFLMELALATSTSAGGTTAACRHRAQRRRRSREPRPTPTTRSPTRRSSHEPPGYHVFLGLELSSPLAASSSPLTGKLAHGAPPEAAGASAIVLPSLFEEEINQEDPRPGPRP